MKRKIIKEHRVLDDTDLNNINNTFKLIEKTFESINKRTDSLEKTTDAKLESSREKFEYSIDVLNGKLNFILWFIGIGFAVLGVLIRMS